ncbi:MAG: hypothetical protein JRN06_02650 [Nitrososphaerota archaeon]|nr:hypothetical protein [Nitrososphaerota archaeon]MDG7023244.1 hypothetical protein [Nitrososphaerota archaeon]
MSALLGTLRGNSAYMFIAAGALWLAVAVAAGSALILWPVVACVLGGVFLRMWPARRLTWAWATSAAVLGFLLAAYQVYAWLPFLGGSFSGVAAVATAVFAVFAVLHLFLFYLGARPVKPAAEQS